MKRGLEGGAEEKMGRFRQKGEQEKREEGIKNKKKENRRHTHFFFFSFWREEKTKETATP